MTRTSDERVPSSMEILEQITAVREELAEHRIYVQNSFVPVRAFDEQIRTLSNEVLRTVSGKLAEMMSDALHSTVAEIRHNGHEEFKAWYEQQQLDDRKERRERLLTIGRGIKSTGASIVMLGAVINVVLLLWLLAHG